MTQNYVKFEALGLDVPLFARKSLRLVVSKRVLLPPKLGYLREFGTFWYWKHAIFSGDVT